MLEKYAIFTNHAKERLKQFGLSLAKANWLLYTGIEEKLPKLLKMAKVRKYEVAKYVRNGSFIFTLIDTSDKYSGDDVYLVVSVYDQRMDI